MRSPGTCLAAAAVLGTIACGGGTPLSPSPPAAGRRDAATVVAGERREYVVSVPRGYDGRTPVPVVFMLHGSSGDGPRFFESSGWKELGEAETVLTVFPSSWRYCIVEDGVRKTTTKWHDYRLGEILCPGERPRDDVAFLRQVIADLRRDYVVDPRRVYVAGFSNGGQMAARVAVEMSDVVAATVSAAGGLPANTAFSPRRRLPVYLMAGETDDRILENTTLERLPMDLRTLFEEPLMQGILASYRATFGLSSEYAVSGDPSAVATATFAGVSGAPENVFVFAVVKGLAHQYPNGANHPLNGARLHWDFLKAYRLP